MYEIYAFYNPNTHTAMLILFVKDRFVLYLLYSISNLYGLRWTLSLWFELIYVIRIENNILLKFFVYFHIKSTIKISLVNEKIFLPHWCRSLRLRTRLWHFYKIPHFLDYSLVSSEKISNPQIVQLLPIDVKIDSSEINYSYTRSTWFTQRLWVCMWC